jgi:hypothetical protein
LSRQKFINQAALDQGTADFLPVQMQPTALKRLGVCEARSINKGLERFAGSRQA